jgi:hypothetical protein
MNPTELRDREAKLFATLRQKLPDFIERCNEPVEVLILHQDAFAAAYQDEEYALLGMAIKYAGLVGKTVHVIGHNRETLLPE